MKNISKLAGIILTFIVLGGLSAFGQATAPVASQQQQNFQANMELQKPMLSLRPGTNAPEIYQGENADIGEQVILRVLPRSTLFMVSVDSQYVYTDNALLTQQNHVPSTEFVNTIVAAFAPTPFRFGPGRIAPMLGYSGQWYNYGLGGNSQLPNGGGPINAVDFDVQSLFAGTKYYLPHNFIAFGQLDYNWFFQQNTSGTTPSGQMFYREWVPDVGIEKMYQIGNNSVLGITASGDWHQSWEFNGPNHGLQNRGDGLLSIAYAYQVTRKLVVQPYYHFQYTYTPKGDNLNPVGNDFLNTFGISAAWFFTPNLSFRLSANDNIKKVSNDSGMPEYHEWDLGGDLAYTLRF